jgi:hypothetical protein
MVLQPEEAARARSVDESGRNRQIRLAALVLTLFAVALLPDRSRADLAGTPVLAPAGPRPGRGRLTRRSG